MNSVIKNIYFLGRRQGIYPFSNTKLLLENSRNGELSGINKIKNLHIVNSITKADIVFLRNKPESTTENQLRKIDSILKNVRSEKLIINDVANFYSIDNKDVTFDIWEKSNLKYPDYCLLYPNDIQKSLEKITKSRPDKSISSQFCLR